MAFFLCVVIGKHEEGGSKGQSMHVVLIKQRTMRKKRGNARREEKISPKPPFFVVF
jgi:hypothetical protein